MTAQRKQWSNPANSRPDTSRSSTSRLLDTTVALIVGTAISFGTLFSMIF